MIRWIRPGCHAVDVGANAGSYVKQFLDCGAASVLAIEPHAEMASGLRVQFPMITVLEAAASDRNGNTTFYYSAQPEHGSLWRANLVQDIERERIVRTVTLDTVCETADIIKIDAQGAEARILAGATRLLREVRPVWYIELWREGLEHAGSSVQAVCDVLEGAGYVPDGAPWTRIREEGSRQSGHGSIDVLAIPQERV